MSTEEQTTLKSSEAKKPGRQKATPLMEQAPVTTKMIYAHYERKTLRAAVNKHRVGVGQIVTEKTDS